MDSSDDLLTRTKAIIEAEKELTRSLDKARPWLPDAPVHHFQPRARPIPQTMDQVHHVLALARVYASRTSAPAGWNPNAPLIGFSTPNPMPHQLRGGQLAALQLEQAKKLEMDRKRKREQVTSAPSSSQDVVMTEAAVPSKANSDEETMDPKKHISHLHDKNIERSKSEISKDDEENTTQRHYRPPMKREELTQPKPSAPDISMNLSDSSSSDEEDDE